jgi:hypothetical protein
MIRFVEVVMVAATIVVAIALYAVKYDTGHVANNIAGLKQQIAEQREAIVILRAEWSLLNQPGRLQQLTEDNLALKPVQAGQMKMFADVPEMPPAEALTDLVQRSLSSLERVESGQP